MSSDDERFVCDIEDCETCRGIEQFWKQKAISAWAVGDSGAERKALDALAVLERGSHVLTSGLSPRNGEQER